MLSLRSGSTSVEIVGTVTLVSNSLHIAKLEHTKFLAKIVIMSEASQ